MRPLDQRGDFVLVHSLQRNGVDLHRKPRRTRRFDAGQNLVEIAPAGDGAEFGGIERIERHVDAANAAIGEFFGKTRQLRPVGRQRQFVKRAGAEMARQRAHQRHHVAANQRLAAGQSKLSSRPWR